MGLPDARRREAGAEPIDDPGLGSHCVDPVETGAPEAREDMDAEQRLVADQRGRLELRPRRQPEGIVAIPPIRFSPRGDDVMPALC